MEIQQELIRGSVAAVVYQNEENGYAVIRLATESDEMITVVGTIPMATVGERLVIAGKWGHHAAYGRQFEAEFLERLMPESAAEILAYLSSRSVKGIGAVTANRIVEAFGSQALEVIENNPQQLTAIQGITPRKANEISECFRKQVGVRRLIEFLSLHNLPPELAMRLYRAYGELAVDAVRDDPYLMTDPMFGAEFGAVDAFALELGVDADDERRVEAGILFELEHNLGNGHTFLPQEKLASATATLLDLDSETISAGLDRLVEQHRMVVDSIAKMQVCYLPEYHEAETYLVQRVLEMADQELLPPENLESLLCRVESEKLLEYAPQQREALRAAACHQLMLLTGGPGTGKTTTL